jgi:Fe-S cluster assembly ATPase SufC
MSTLTIKGLKAEVEGKEILKGIDLELEPGRSPRP